MGGESSFQGWVGPGWEKSWGEVTTPGIWPTEWGFALDFPEKGDFWQKKTQFGIKKKSFAGNADGNEVLLKSSSFVEAWAGFCQLIAQAAVVFKKKYGNLGQFREFDFSSPQGEIPWGSLPFLPHPP